MKIAALIARILLALVFVVFRVERFLCDSSRPGRCLREWQASSPP